MKKKLFVTETASFELNAFLDQSPNNGEHKVCRLTIKIRMKTN